MKLLEELPLSPGVSIVMNEGRWSAHNLLSYLLSVVPNAQALISTYSIGEDAIRMFDDERIESLGLIIDRTMLRHKVALIEFALHTRATIRVCDNHSKVLVLENATTKVAFIGSQNYTKNRRVEMGVLFYNCREVDEVRAKMERMFELAYPL